jgi:starvation-inducible DNA-binding protein
MEMDSLLDIKFTRSHALSEEVRAEVTSRLYGLIASYIDASGIVLEAHWNSEGNNFIAVHTLFGDIVGLLNGFVDPLGERIRSFGGTAKANLRYALENTLLIETQAISNNIDSNIQAVVTILKRLSELLYMFINSLDSLDKTTSNILQDQCNSVDKYIYLLQSHLFNS